MHNNKYMNNAFEPYRRKMRIAEALSKLDNNDFLTWGFPSEPGDLFIIPWSDADGKPEGVERKKILAGATPEEREYIRTTNMLLWALIEEVIVDMQDEGLIKRYIKEVQAAKLRLAKSVTEGKPNGTFFFIFDKTEARQIDFYADDIGFTRSHPIRQVVEDAASSLKKVTGHDIEVMQEEVRECRHP